MAFIQPGKTANKLDRNAVSPDRTRRNWQRIQAGAVTPLVQISPTGSLILTPTGLAVELNPDGAIVSTSSGLAVSVDGTTVSIINDQLVAIGGTGLTHQQVMQRISLGI